MDTYPQTGVSDGKKTPSPTSHFATVDHVQVNAVVSTHLVSVLNNTSRAACRRLDTACRHLRWAVQCVVGGDLVRDFLGPFGPSSPVLG